MLCCANNYLKEKTKKKKAFSGGGVEGKARRNGINEGLVSEQDPVFMP